MKDFTTQQSELSLQAADIAESAFSIKGPNFANAVNSLYALHGMQDLSGRLVDALPEAEPYRNTVRFLHANVQEQLLAALPERDRAEALRLSQVMITNQRALHERIDAGRA